VYSASRAFRPSGRSILTRALLLSAVAAAFALTEPARAQGRGVSIATAEALFREGTALLDEKRYAEACPKLAESHRLDPATGTLLALAFCHEGEGRLASAWAEFAEVAGRAREEGRTDREQVAREHAANLEPRLARLSIEVPPEVRALPGLVVSRDSVEIAEAVWNTPVPVDPGLHVVTAKANGKKEWQGEASVAKEGEKASVAVPMLVDAPPEPEAAPEPSETAKPVAVDDTKRTYRIAGIATAGVGVVSLGLSAYFGLHAMSKNDDSNSGCNEQNRCTDEAKQARLDARSSGDWATGTLVAGTVLVGAGAVLYFVVGREPNTERSALTVTPVVGLSGGAVIATGRF
jgi:hypothetical protein